MNILISIILSLATPGIFASQIEMPEENHIISLIGHKEVGVLNTQESMNKWISLISADRRSHSIRCSEDFSQISIQIYKQVSQFEESSTSYGLSIPKQTCMRLLSALNSATESTPIELVFSKIGLGMRLKNIRYMNL